MTSTTSLLALLLSSTAHAGPPVLPEEPPVAVPEPTPGPDGASPSPSAPTPGPDATERGGDATSGEVDPTVEATAEPVVTPEPAAEAPAPVVASEPLGPGPEPHAPATWDEHDLPEPRDRESEGWTRELNGRGVTMSLGLGLGGCGETFCVENPVSAIGRGVFGYRLPRVAFVATMAGGGGPRTGLPGSMRLLGADVGVEVFPTGPGKIEPYIGLGLGYMRVKQTSVSSEPGGTESDLDVYIARGAVRASVGLPFRLGRRWALGPRFDYTWGFAGKVCGSNSFGSDCQPLADSVDDIAGSSEKLAVRAVKRALLPQPWALTLEVRAVF